jgi:hypothetical protein
MKQRSGAGGEMKKAYINATDARVTVHNNPNCDAARIKINQDQRTVLLNTDTLSRELRRFRNNEYRFAPGAGENDIWVMLDFQDPAFEDALARYLERLVGQGQKTSRNWELKVHC